MKITVDGVLVFEERFDTTDSFVDRYRDDEIDQGREVPRYAWETLALLVGGWLLKKVADELFKWVAEYRKRAKAQEKEQQSETLEERRHGELLHRLDALIAMHQRPQDDVEWLRAILSEEQLAIEVYIDTDAEADLIPAFEQHLHAINSAVITRWDQLKHGDKI